MQFMPDELTEIVKSVWESMLGSEIAPVLESDRNAFEGTCLASQVSISGEWNGEFILYSSVDAMRLAASIMFKVDLDDVTNEDVYDITGELANMVSGNLKALLPQPSQLGLPSVIEGDDYTLHIPESQLLTCLDFLWGEQPVVIELLGSTRDGSASIGDSGSG